MLLGKLCNILFKKHFVCMIHVGIDSVHLVTSNPFLPEDYPDIQYEIAIRNMC